MGNAAGAASTFHPENSLFRRQSFQRFFNAPMREKQSRIEMDHILARLTEAEISRLNDPGMNRTDRHLEHPLAMDAGPLVFRRLLLRFGALGEVLSQGMTTRRPMLMQHQRSQIGMPHRHKAKQIVDLPLVPSGSRQQRRQ